MKTLCWIFGKAWVENYTGVSYCVWRYTSTQESNYSWMIVVAAILLFVFFAIRKSGAPKRTENEVIVDELNRLIPAYQEEATRNLTTANPSYEAEKTYKAFVGQIKHDGHEYRWK